MRRLRGRRVVLGLGAVGAVVVLLLALGWFPQEPLRRLGERKLREALGPGAKVGGLSLTPGLLRGELRDVVIVAPGYRIEAARLRVALAPGILLGHALAFRSVVAEGLKVTLEGRAPVKPTSQSAPTIVIGDLQVADALFVYHDLGSPGDLTLEGVSASGGIGSGVLSVAARGGSWDSGRRLELGPVRGRLALSPQLALDVQSLEARLRESQVQVSGQVDSRHETLSNGRFEARLQLDELEPLVGDQPVTGRLELTGTVTGPLQMLQGQLEARSERLTTQGIALEAVELRAERDAQGQGHAHATAKTLGGGIDAQAALRGAAVDLIVDAKGLQTSRLPRDRDPLGGLGATLSGRVTAGGTLPGTLQVKGDLRAVSQAEGFDSQVSGTFSGSVRSDMGHVDLDWRADFRSQAREQPPAAARLTSLALSGTGTVRGADTFEVQAQVDGGMQVVSGSEKIAIPIRGQLTQHERRLDAELDSEGRAGRVHVSLRARPGQVERLEAQGRELKLEFLPGGGRGHAEFSLSASGPAERLSGNGNALVDDLVWRETDIGSARADLRLDAGRGHLHLDVPALAASADAQGQIGATSDVRATLVLKQTPLARLARLLPEPLGNGTLSAEIALGLTGSGPARRMELRATGISLATHAARAAGNADVVLSGDTARPRATGTVDLADVQWSGAAGPLIAAPSLTVTLAGDQLILSDARAQLGGGELRLTGHVPFASLYGASASLPAAASNAVLDGTWERVSLRPLMAALGRGDSALSALVSGELHLTGPLARPGSLNGSARVVTSEARVEDLDLEIAPLVLELRAGRLSASEWSVASAGARLQMTLTADLQQRIVDGAGSGQLDLRTLRPLLAPQSASGIAEVALRVHGSFDAPDPQGSLTLRDVTVRFPEVAQPLTHLNGTLNLEGGRVTASNVTGQLGGGTLTLTGGARLAKGALTDVDFALQGRDLNLRHTSGFRSQARADLTLRGSSDALWLGGALVLERGLYDTDIFLEDALLAPEPPVSSDEAPSFLQSIQLDLGVETARAILVRNNLAEVAATGNLRLRGDLARPAPFGRLELRPRGKVFLQTREFTIDSGSLAYTGTLDPEVSLRAEGEISQVGAENVVVTVNAEGTLGDLKLHLTSEPPYSERELASLIATGRRDLGLDNSAWVAGEQAAVLLAGRLTRSVERGFKDLGLDEVRIQPELLAREADPAARFTFGKQLTPRLKLAYSVGLNDPEARLFEAQYRVRVGREATLRVLRDDRATYTVGAGQRFHWGGPPRTTRTRREARQALTPLQEVRVEVTPPFTPDELRKRVHVKAGKRVSDWDLQDDTERLQKYLRKRSYLDAAVDVREDQGTAVFSVRPGLRYGVDVRGMSGAPDLSGLVRKAEFPEQALDTGREKLLAAAHAKGYLKAKVETEVAEHAPDATLVFKVELGQSRRADVRFEGAKAVSGKRLLEVSGGSAGIVDAPDAAHRAMFKEYERHYYPAVKIDGPVVTDDGGATPLAVVTQIDEGPRSLLAGVRFEGTQAPQEELTRLAALEIGKPYDPGILGPALQRVRDDYLKRGYPAVHVVPQLQPVGNDLELVFFVSEGARITVGEIRIEGLARTRESLVRRQIQLKTGDALDPRQLVRLEKRLLDLGTFTRVVASASEGNPADILIHVEEEPRYTVAYDARWNDIERIHGLLDGEIDNLFGRGVGTGARYEAGRGLRTARLSAHVPSVGKAGDFTAALFWREEDPRVFKDARHVASAAAGALRLVERGLELQQTLHLPSSWDLIYGYRFKRFWRDIPPLQLDLSGITTSLVRDSRDNPLDARKGLFLSLSVDVVPRALGSEVGFQRVFAQTFIHTHIGGPFTWSQGYRLGASHGLNESRLRDVDFGHSTEFFRAGGGNSVRGYALDVLGPVEPGTLATLGGEGVLIINQELRYRHPTGFGGVLFYDLGNAFTDPRDISFKLQHAVGVGLRYASPVGLLRVDLGFPLNRRSQDKGYQVYFSLGQAF